MDYSTKVKIHIKKRPKKKTKDKERVFTGSRSFLNSGIKSEAPIYKKLPAANKSTKGIKETKVS